MVGSLYEKLYHYRRQIVKSNVIEGYQFVLQPAVMISLRATLTSYWGLIVTALELLFLNVFHGWGYYLKRFL